MVWFCTLTILCSKYNSTVEGNCWKGNVVIDIVHCMFELLLRFSGHVLSLVSPAACLLGTGKVKQKNFSG